MTTMSAPELNRDVSAAKRAALRGPVVITDRGEEAFVLLSIEEYRRLPLAIDLAVARRAARMHVPDPRPERDTMIAATAGEHGMTVVTRNVQDFAPTGIPVIDPWDAG